MQIGQLYVEASEHLGMPHSQGTTQAFEHIASSALPSFYRRAYRLLGNCADAEDAVQDALLAAYTHLDQFKGKSQLSTWMTAIVHNSARMHLRTRHRHVHVPLDEQSREGEGQPWSEWLAEVRPSPEEECRNSELGIRLRHFYRQLSPTLRRTFQLRDINGLSIRETAQILGLPHGTVKAQSARARKKLRELMRRTLKRRCPNITGLNSGRAS